MSDLVEQRDTVSPIRSKAWRYCSLLDVADFTSGKPQEGDISTSGVAWLITLDSVDINGNLKKRHKRVRVNDGSLRHHDLVTVLSDLAHGNLLGLTAEIPAGDTYVLNQRMGRLRVRDNNVPAFLRLQINAAQIHFKNSGQGTSQRHIYKRDFANLFIAVPSRQEQAKIAASIDDAEALIARLELLIAKQRAIKQGLMQQLLTDKVSPSDFSGSWHSRKLLEISEFITKGSTPTTYGYQWQDTGILFLRSECVSAHGLDLKQAMYISEEANRSLRRSQVTDGDILMTITGNVGRVVHLHGLGVANINQHIARIRVRHPQFDSDFVYQYLSQKSMRDHYESITTGQAYPQISLAQVRNTIITAPPIQAQRKLANILKGTDSEINSLERFLAKAIAVKQGMMQELLTGRTRLPVKEAVS